MTRLNLGCHDHRLEGFDNLDLPEWRYEDGLGQYTDGSVEGITSSHSQMYVALEDWPAMYVELARVLQPGGILRVTEDATDDPESERYGGWHDAVTLTSAKLVRKHMRQAGLVVTSQGMDTTGFVDLSLIQAHHGASPKVFVLEGRKP